MQNLKSFLIAFAVGFVLFGAFALTIPGMLTKESPNIPVSTTVPEAEIKNEENNTETNIQQQSNSFTAILGGYDSNNGELDALVVIKADGENERFVVAAIPTYLRVPFTGVDVATGNSLQSYVRLRDFPELFGREKAKDVLLDTVHAITGMKIDYYAMFNKDAFYKVFEKTGGIYYTVKEDMYYIGAGIQENPEINIKSGGQVLTGPKALSVMRYMSYSENEIQGELSRAKTQADFISQMLKQLVDLDEKKLVDGLGVILPLCETNFTTVDFVNNFDLISKFKEYSNSSAVVSLEVSDPINYSYTQKIFDNYK